MSELKLTIETGWSLGSALAAERVLGVLTKHSDWAPTRFGTQEPLRQHFRLGTDAAFVSAWGEATTGKMGSFHFANRGRYHASVIWWTQGRSINSLHFTFDVKSGDQQAPVDCLALGEELFDAVQGQYGYLCVREEYWSKNVTEDWAGRTGQPEGGRAHGTDRTKHLPGLYWANFFGPIYVEFFSLDRLRTAPAYTSRINRRGWTVLTSASPYEWDTPETLGRAEAIREHLGSDAFFSLREPLRATRAPSFPVEPQST